MPGLVQLRADNVNPSIDCSVVPLHVPFKTADSKTSLLEFRRILMGFYGQGSQYQGMGRYLAQQFSGFSAIITDAANKASVLTGYPVLPFLVDQSGPPGLSIDLCFHFQYSVCTWSASMPMPSWATQLGRNCSSRVCTLLMSPGFFFCLQILFSDYSGSQFQSWFAVCGRQGRPSSRRSCTS